MSKHDHGGHVNGPHDGRDATAGSTKPDQAGQFDQGHVDAARTDGADLAERPYPRLEDCDLSLKLSKDEEAKRLGKAQRRLLHLRLINGGQLNNGVLGPPVCIVFEGWDAAGKGGAIKRLVEPSTPVMCTSLRSPRRRPTSCATISCGASGRRCPDGVA